MVASSWSLLAVIVVVALLSVSDGYHHLHHHLLPRCSSSPLRSVRPVPFGVASLPRRARHDDDDDDDANANTNAVRTSVVSSVVQKETEDDGFSTLRLLSEIEVTVPPRRDDGDDDDDDARWYARFGASTSPPSDDGVLVDATFGATRLRLVEAADEEAATATATATTPVAIGLVVDRASWTELLKDASPDERGVLSLTDPRYDGVIVRAREGVVAAVEYVETTVPRGAAAPAAAFLRGVFDATADATEHAGDAVALAALGAVDSTTGRAARTLLWRESSTSSSAAAATLTLFVGADAEDFSVARRNCETAGVLGRGAGGATEFRTDDVTDLATGRRLFCAPLVLRSVEHETWPGEPRP